MRIEKSVVIDASREEVWELVSNPLLYPRFMHGVTQLAQSADEVVGLRRPPGAGGVRDGRRGVGRRVGTVGASRRGVVVGRRVRAVE